MSVLNFGMSFILKGIVDPKVSPKLLTDGLFQVYIDMPLYVATICTHSMSFYGIYRLIYLEEAFTSLPSAVWFTGVLRFSYYDTTVYLTPTITVLSENL